MNSTSETLLQMIPDRMVSVKVNAIDQCSNLWPVGWSWPTKPLESASRARSLGGVHKQGLYPCCKQAATRNGSNSNSQVLMLMLLVPKLGYSAMLPKSVDKHHNRQRNFKTVLP